MKDLRVVVIGVLLGWVTTSAVGQEGRPPKPVSDPPRAVSSAQKALAEACVRGFFAAKTVEEKAKFVADVERVKPLMEAYYKRHPIEAEGAAEIVDHRECRSHSGDSGIYFSMVFELSDFTERQWVFQIEKEGGLRLVWDAVFNFEGREWQDFVSEKDTTPAIFRVSLTPSDYHNFEFSNRKEFACFKVEAAGSHDYVYGYVSNESQLAKDLLKRMILLTEFYGKKFKDPIPVTAKLRFPAHSKDDQVIIEDIREYSWVHGEDPRKQSETSDKR